MTEIDLRGFRFADAPVQWVLSPADPKVATLQSLLEKFMEEWQWGKKPLGWARDPVNKKGDPLLNPCANWIVAPYRRDFYITIGRSFNEIFGPHAVRLMYRPWQLESDCVWVAVCQIRAMWHSDKRLLEAMLMAIDAGELFQSKETADTIVIL